MCFVPSETISRSSVVLIISSFLLPVLYYVIMFLYVCYHCVLCLLYHCIVVVMFVVYGSA